MTPGQTRHMTSTSPLDRSKVGRSKIKIWTFMVTVSPKDDISSECQERCVQELKKYLSAYAVLERGSSGKLHFHAACCAATCKETKHWKEQWVNIMMKYHPDSNSKKGVDVRVMYDHRWYNEYLRKEQDVYVVYDKYNIDCVTEYFPSQEIQTELQTISSKCCVGDDYMVKLEARWIEYSPDGASYEDAVEFLKWRMNCQRDMQVITDKRRLCNLAFALYEFRNKIFKPCVEEVNHGARMTGNSSMSI